jgi:hypothetical protein
MKSCRFLKIYPDGSDPLPKFTQKIYGHFDFRLLQIILTFGLPGSLTFYSKKVLTSTF